MIQEKSLHAKLIDISPSISWGDIARRYFSKSTSYFYQRLNGVDGRGMPCDFTEQERETLRAALLDLSQRISQAAATI